MQRYKWIFLGLLLAAVATMTFQGCKTEGFDGDGSISGRVAHHGLKIPDATVYIKFHATELPSTNVSDFDASVQSDSNGDYTISSLKKGKYYLYAVGYDSSISQVVRGGLAVSLKNGENATAALAVTE